MRGFSAFNGLTYSNTSAEIMPEFFGTLKVRSTGFYHFLPNLDQEARYFGISLLNN